MAIAALPFLQPFIAPITEIVKQVLNRLLPPEKISEAERARVEAETMAAIMAQDWRQIEAEYRDRADARQLAQADMSRGNAFTGILAATVRPVWGYASLIVVAYPYLAGALHWPAVNIDGPTKDIVQMVIMFYFGGRTIEKVLPQMIRGK